MKKPPEYRLVDLIMSACLAGGIIGSFVGYLLTGHIEGLACVAVLIAVSAVHQGRMETRALNEQLDELARAILATARTPK